MAAYRRAAGMVQADAAARLHYQRSSIANIETGRQNADRRFWAACDELFAASGTLLAAYDGVAALDRSWHLQAAIRPTPGGPLADDERPSSRPATAGRRPRANESVRPGRADIAAQDDEASEQEEDALRWDYPQALTHLNVNDADLDQLLDYFTDQWHQLVRADNLLGPRHALAAVKIHLPALRELMVAKRGADRARIVSVAARYAESASWLHEDLGDLRRSSTWVHTAMDWAQEIGDPTMTAWSAYRRSQLALNGSDTDRIIGLARAALRDEDLLQPAIIAACITQEARGLARDGSAREALHRLDAAHRWAAHDDTGAASDGHGSFCTPAYIEGQRGLSLLDLGQPKPAAHALATSLSTLPAVYRRDRAMFTAGLADAYAQCKEIDHAATVARQSLLLARSTGSQRSEKVVRVVADTLGSHRRNAHVAALLEELEQVS